jgi:maltose O-acetyltransferase
VAWYRLLGAQIGRACWMQNVSIPRNPWNIHIGTRVALDQQVILLATGEDETTDKIVIGDGTYVNRFTIIDAAGRIMIGQNCMIGPHCYITDHDHGTSPGQRVSEQALDIAPVTIGDNVWIGAGVIILKGVSIGDDAVVAAGAVVTRNVAPASRVAGVPAVSMYRRVPLGQEGLGVV